MTMVKPVWPFPSTQQSPMAVSDPVGLRPGFDLLGCIRALDGWVSPDGLAPRAVLDRLVEQGALEAWPGRPLYRAPRNAPVVPANSGGDAP